MAVLRSLTDLSGLVRGSALVRRSSVMFTGVVAAKVVGVISLLLLARLYGAEAFGLLGIFQALVISAAVVASLGYQPAIALPSRDDEGASVLWLSLGLVGIAVVVATGIVALFRLQIAGTLDAPAMAGLLWWAPALLLALGLYEVLVYWLTRRRDFKRLAGSRVIMALAVAATQVGAWLAGAATDGLVVGLTVGTWIAVALLCVQTLAQDVGRLIPGLSWPRMRAQAKIYRQFPAYHAPASALSAASMAVLPLGLGYFFGPAVVGIYWLADRVCGYLTTLVRQSMQQVFLNRAAEVAHAAGDVRSLFERTTLGLFWLALVPTVVLVVAGPFVFGVVFGAEWVEAGTYARWLAVAWLFSLLNIPAVQLAAVYDLQRWTLWYSIGLAVFRAAAIVVGGMAGDPLLAVMIHAASTAGCSGGLVLAMGRHLRRVPAGRAPNDTAVPVP